MPRPSLPLECKSLYLFDVTLTQDTKESILAYYTNEFETFRSTSGKINRKKDAFVNEQWSYNPYERCSWRGFRSPSRIEFNWANSEDELEEAMWILHYKRDLILLIRLFELEGEFPSMLFDVEKAISLSMEYDAEFKLVDSRNYTVAYKAWKESHASQLAEEAMMDKHNRGTHTLEFWTTAMKVGGEEFFEEHIKPQIEHCKACKSQQQIKEDIAEFKRMESEASRRDTEDPVSIPSIPSTPRLYTCDSCSFETQHNAVYHRHIESREHLASIRRSKLWCADCGVQSRTQLEHDHHCASRKHRQTVGDITKESESFRCECCSFSTTHKHVYKRHCESNSHKEKVNA